VNVGIRRSHGLRVDKDVEEEELGKGRRATEPAQAGGLEAWKGQCLGCGDTFE
jgi:hypothetical protein